MALNYKPKPLADIFTKDSEIDRRKCIRTKSMKVLCLGLGRTGTASLREALKHLGFIDTYHMISASVENPLDSIMWHQALSWKFEGIGGKFTRDDWDKLLGHCEAVCDWPAALFAEELIEAYPEAKVILNVRDVDPWYCSTQETVYWRATDPVLRFLSHFDWASGYYYPMIHKMFDTFFRGDFLKYGKEVFLEHNEEVRKLVGSDNLLEYTVSEGWGPLCELLDVEVPVDVPFPRINDASGFRQRCKRRNRRQMYNVIFRWSQLWRFRTLKP